MENQENKEKFYGDVHEDIILEDMIENIKVILNKQEDSEFTYLKDHMAKAIGVNPVTIGRYVKTYSEILLEYHLCDKEMKYFSEYGLRFLQSINIITQNFKINHNDIKRYINASPEHALEIAINPLLILNQTINHSVKHTLASEIVKAANDSLMEVVKDNAKKDQELLHANNLIKDITAKMENERTELEKLRKEIQIEERVKEEREKAARLEEELKNKELESLQKEIEHLKSENKRLLEEKEEQRNKKGIFSFFK